MDLENLNVLIKKNKSPNLEYEEFLEQNAKLDPFEQFVDWFQEALVKEHRPTFMTLATVDEKNFPDTRMVAIQELQYNQFIFYSSYQGRKARHILHNNIIAANFYWPNCGRQVRLKGRIEKLSREQCENYFSERRKEIQLTVHAWTQSTVLLNREELDKQLQKTAAQFENKLIPCPDHWGGYVIIPFEYELYQRRKSLLNDIFLYTLQHDNWQRVRLAP